MQGKQQNIYLSLCLVGLILALLVPSIRLLLFMALFFYGAALGLYQDEKKKLIRKLSIVFFFVLASTLPLIFARVAGGGNNSDTLVAWSSWGITEAGVELATLVGLRAITAFGAVLLMTQIVPIYELFRRLKSSPYVPDLFVELLEMVYRYIHVLDEMREQIYEAQVCRLAYTGSFRKRMADTTMLISRTFVQAHSEVNKLYDGLLSRGFDASSEEEVEDEKGTTFNTEMMNEENKTTDFLKLEKVSYQYEQKYTALRGLNLSVKKGERIVLLGENGAGKSTLMKLLCGLLPMQSGNYYLNGQQIAAKAKSLKEVRKQIALVFQNANHQLFCASVEDEIAFGLCNAGLKEDEVQAKVEKVLQDFDLEELRTIPPHKLSEGQKKWVSLAAILALDPEVILLDEPTASLDCYHTNKVLELLIRLNQEGKTLILSTHNMDLAYEWAERVLVMSKGELLADAQPEEVFANKQLLEQALLDEPYQLKKKVEGAKIKSSEQAFLDIADKSGYDLALFLKASEIKVLFVGGGKSAFSKIERLLQRGAKITVLSPQLNNDLQKLYEQGLIEYIASEFDETFDLQGYQMIVAATGIASVDRLVLSKAKEAKKLHLALALPNEGNAHFTAQSSTSGIDIAIHTQYRLPEISKLIKELVGKSLPAHLEEDLQSLSELRQAYIGQKDEASRQQYEALKEEISKKIEDVWTHRD